MKRHLWCGWGSTFSKWIRSLISITTNYCKRGDFEEHEFIILQICRLEIQHSSKTKMLAAFLPGGSRGKSISLLLQLLDASCFPWFVVLFLHLRNQKCGISVALLLVLSSFFLWPQLGKCRIIFTLERGIWHQALNPLSLLLCSEYNDLQEISW